MNLNTLFSPTNLRLWLLVLFAGLAALGSYWALEIVRGIDAGANTAVRTRPDYWVENFNFVKMLPTGQYDYRIVGTKLVHFPNDDHAEVTLPVVTNLDPERLPMTTRSERAIVKNLADQSKSEVHMYEKVVVDRPKTDLAEHLQMDTEYLLVYPDKHSFETDLPVRILSGDTVTTGVGMRANNDTQQSEILHDVLSIIPPRPDQNRKQPI